MKQVATSKDIRKRLKVFDGGFFKHKVSKTALLKDTEFYTPTIESLVDTILDWVKWIEKKKITHTGANGRFDCDNFAGLCCHIVKLWHHLRATNNEQEYAIFPCALEENHTICICFTTSGIWFVEPQTGECWSINTRKPNVLYVG